MFRNVTSLAIVACIATTSLIGVQTAQAGPYPLPVLKKMLKVAQEQLAKVEKRIEEVKTQIQEIESSSGGSTDNGPAGGKDSARLADLRHELSKLFVVAKELRAHIESLQREIASAEKPGTDSVD